MTLHLNLPGSHHRSAEQQAQLREARRLLRDKIRNDWEYPPLPAWKSSGRHEAANSAATEELNVEDRIAGFRFHAPSTPDRANGVVGEALGLGFEPIEWREREDSDVSETESEVAAMTPAHTTSSSSKSKVETYKFDAPDSVGPQLHSRQQARKRKRWQAVHEEMEWNDGLAHWTRRRDVWCCARETRDVRLLEGSSGSGLADHAPPARGIVHIEVDSGSASGGSTPRTSTSSSVEAHVSSTPASTPSGSPDVTGAAAGSTAGTSLRSSPATIPLDVLVPIAPALLPKHPIRKRINHDMYPEIYNKIILQSRTPSVPINLLTLLRALVQGWKDDGEWPPKPGVLEKSFTTRRKRGGSGGGGGEGSLKSGVKAVGRVLRLTSSGGGGGGVPS
ncbi:uncharacterized protein SEPMUDRAFT_112543 [Sphaerulina musiva SO2202]|uniref:Gag1-like clamp domain-containing protein n=1 Tax=Sphaerulina musiva (strain SO2202) TaxID=692275 RepID=N1QMA4_SPHMS|nr:uncharacterized protein SEPMUDRAFT_112543 [Sphaerulina musiva SO2202]EMF16499.1 hypothetical protein SEPMUDRAFT_112543 [Sphaerulina musiva SO2202]